MFKVEYKISENDYLLFNEYHLLNSASGKRNLLGYRLILPMICLLSILLYTVAKSLTGSYVAVLSIATILWLLFSKKLLVSGMKRNIKKLARDGKLPYSKEGVLIFDEDFINDINTTTESKTRYSCIEKCCITENAIYLYFSAMQAYIVPMSAFSTEEDKQEFIKFINSKI